MAEPPRDDTPAPPVRDDTKLRAAITEESKTDFDRAMHDVSALDGKQDQKDFIRTLVANALASGQDGKVFELARDGGLDKYMDVKEREGLFMKLFGDSDSFSKVASDLANHRQSNEGKPLLSAQENYVLMQSIIEDGMNPDPFKSVRRLNGQEPEETERGQALTREFFRLMRQDLESNGMSGLPADPRLQATTTAQDVAVEYVTEAALTDDGGKALLAVMLNNRDNPELSAALQKEIKTEIDNNPDGSLEKQRLKTVVAQFQGAEVQGGQFVSIDVNHDLKSPQSGGAKPLALSSVIRE